MENRSIKVYLGSVPGNLSSVKLAEELERQLVSFVKVETNKSNARDKEVKNKGYAFLTISDPAEYQQLLRKEKVLTIGSRIIKVSEYKAGPVTNSEKILAASKKICIKGLPDWVTDEDLRIAFHTAGLFPETVFRAQRNSTHENLPFGFAEFQEPFLAEMALKRQRILLPGTEVYLTLERFMDKSTKAHSPNRIQQPSIGSQTPSSSKMEILQQKDITLGPKSISGTIQQTATKQTYNKVWQVKRPANSESVAPNPQFEGSEASPRLSGPVFLAKPLARLAESSPSSSRRSVLPKVESQIRRHFFGSLLDGSDLQEELDTIRRNIDDSPKCSDLNSHSNKPPVPRKLSAAQRQKVQELGYFHRHSSQHALLSSRFDPCLPNREIPDRASETTLLMMPWLESVKNFQHQMVPDGGNNNLRFNVNISPMQEYLS